MSLFNQTIFVGILQAHTTFLQCEGNATVRAQNVLSCNPTVSVQIFLRILAKFNATIQYVIFQNFGTWAENDSSLTSALIRGNIDMSFYQLIITEQRVSLLEVAMPLVFTPLEIYFPEPQFRTELFSSTFLISPFDWKVWAVSLAILLSITVLAKTKGLRNSGFFQLLEACFLGYLGIQIFF